MVELIETADVVATLGQQKSEEQWVVGFALETEDQRFARRSSWKKSIVI